MNDIESSSKTTSIPRTNKRVYAKRNRTTTVLSTKPYLLTTTATLSANSSLLSNTSAVTVDDLFVPVTYFTQYKYIFIGGFSFLISLCLISILFLIILKFTRRKCKERKLQLDRKRIEKIRDFLDDHHDGTNESPIPLESYNVKDPLLSNALQSNGVISYDNISTTVSLDPMIEQKISRNNPTDANTSMLMADDTSLDTLRGSMISSPSQHASIHQVQSTSTSTPLKDIVPSSIEPSADAEKDDGLRDLDFKGITPRYTKIANNSSGYLNMHRSSASSLEQTIRRQERLAEEKERGNLHGSNSNLYEKEIRKKAEQEKIARKEHTHSQTSLYSRTSEDSCY